MNTTNNPALRESKNLPSVFARSDRKRGVVPPNLAELESFNLLGVFDNQPREDSPTIVELKSTSIFANSNPSFDNYFAEMRKRNQNKSFMLQNETNGFSMTAGSQSGAKKSPKNIFERRKSYAASNQISL